MAERPDPTSWSCPVPDLAQDRVVAGHGGGGTMTAELVSRLFLPAFGPAAAGATPTDAAVLDLGVGGRLAFTTDAHVVQPLEFPGGDIGELAVFGTVNDLAMVGARPLALSVAVVLEEGLELAVLARIATSMGQAAVRAGVMLATGDTKVVERGRGDGLHITTSGVGLVPDGVELDAARARPGDVVVVSGPIGRHGVAVMAARHGLELGPTLRSDTAPLHALVAAALAVGPRVVRVLRDPTRGGLAGAVCDLAAAGGVGIEIDDEAVPVPDDVRAACGLLGLDPWHVANEGVAVGIVAADAASDVLDALRGSPEGAGACRVGRVVAEHPGVVVARTALGAARLVDQPVGEQLPRIC